MAVKIRLRRMGQKKAPFYRIVVADSRSKRDGKCIAEIGTYEVVNTLTDDQKSAAPVLASQESDEAEVTSSEESVEATQPESQAQENESNEAETNAQNQQVTTAAAGPTIPHQTYRYQLTINNLTIVIIGVIFAIAIVVAILAVTLIRRRNKDDDDDV